MASKNLLPVTALCSALATGMPVAALATPAVDIPLPAVNCLATNQMSTIARQRFSLAQASISASGCLRRCTNSSIVVDTERSSTADGPLTGCIICTWRAAATDADGDSCDVELRLDITRQDAPAMQTFGAGMHYCLGVHLAKMELAEALALMTQRMPNARVTGPVPWKPLVGLSGPLTLPIAFDRVDQSWRAAS